MPRRRMSRIEHPPIICRATRRDGEPPRQVVALDGEEAVPFRCVGVRVSKYVQVGRFTLTGRFMGTLLLQGV